ASFNMFDLHAPPLRTMEFCRSHSLSLLPLPAPSDRLQYMEEFSHENITRNSCIGGAAELVCSCSIRRLAGRLLPCLRSGAAVCRVSLLRLQPCLRSGLAVCRVLRCLRSGPVLSHPRLLRPLRPTLTVSVQRVRHSWQIRWLGSGSPRAQSAGARSPGNR